MCYSHRPAISWVHYTTSCNTQSSAPEDGQNNCPKHVELNGIINKQLLLHLVGCLYYLYVIYHVCTAIISVRVIQETINELFEIAEKALRRKRSLEQVLILHLQLQFSFHYLF